MEQQPSQPHLSPAFIATLVSHDPQHTIPHEFVLKALELPDYTHLPRLGHLPSVGPRLEGLQQLMEDHDLLPFLHSQGMHKILKTVSSLFREFTQKILPALPRLNFYLGTDRSSRQEHSLGSYLIISDEDQPSLRWETKQGTSSSWVWVGVGEELVMIGRGEQGKEWQGVKLYTREGFSAVQLGRWKGTTPKITLMAKYPQEGQLEVYLREFSGRKVLRGELRYVKGGVLYRYRENGGFLVTEETGNSRPSSGLTSP